MQTNFQYQAKVARSLVQSCGLDDAIEFCRSNQWEGVLSQILKQYRHTQPVAVN